MRNLAKTLGRLLFRAAAIVFLVGAVAFPFTPGGYFALLPILAGVTFWALSDFEWLLPFRRSPFKTGRVNLF